MIEKWVYIDLLQLKRLDLLSKIAKELLFKL